MEGGIKFSASKLQKLERKIIEKNRRNQMKSLYSHLYSLVPPTFISKGENGVSDRVDRTIDYIQTLKNNLEMSKNKKEKLLSKKRPQEHTKINNNACRKSLDIQIHQISHDLDAVLVTGLNSYSSFCDVVQLLHHRSAEVTLTSFSSIGHSIFHIREKQIEAEDVCKRIKNLADRDSSDSWFCNEVNKYSNMKDSSDSWFYNKVESDLNVWDFDFQSSGWECELGVILNGNG